jgi:hypothetical protein
MSTWFDRPMTIEDVPSIDADEQESQPRYEVHRLGFHEVIASGDDLPDMQIAAQEATWNDNAYAIWDSLTESYCAIAYQGVMFWE